MDTVQTRSRRPRPLAAAFAAAVALLGAAAGCGADEELDTARAAAGGLSASLLRPQAEDAFSRKGHPIAGRLECSADAGDSGVVRVDCTGITRDEEQAEVSGRVGFEAVTGRESGDDGLPGRFVGRVAGDEVFVVTCFDCKPEPVVQEDGGGDGGADGGADGANADQADRERGQEADAEAGKDGG